MKMIEILLISRNHQDLQAAIESCAGEGMKLMGIMSADEIPRPLSLNGSRPVLVLDLTGGGAGISLEGIPGNLPLVIVSEEGFDCAGLPPALSHGACLEKPFTPRELRLSLRLAVEQADRKKRDQALRENRQKLTHTREFYKALIANADESIAVIDEKGTIIYEAPAIERMLGWKPEELVGTSVFDIIHPDDRERGRTLDFPRLVNCPGKVMRNITRVRHRDGSWRSIEGFRVNLLDNPAVGGIVLNYRDVTEQLRAEEEICHRLAMEELVASISSTFINVLPGEVGERIEEALKRVGQFVGVESAGFMVIDRESAVIEEIYRWRTGEVLTLTSNDRGSSIAEMKWSLDRFRKLEMVVIDSCRRLPPEAREDRLFFERYNTSSYAALPVEIGSSSIGILAFVKKNQEKTWVERDLRLLRLVSDIFANAIARKAIAEKLRKSEEFFRHVTENMHDAITVIDRAGNRIYVSPSQQKLTGHAPGDLEGKSILGLIHPDDLEAVREQTRRYLAAEDPPPGRGEFRVRHKKGHYIWAEATSKAHMDGDGRLKCVTISTRDISDRKRAEEQLRILNEKLEQKVDERTRELARAVEELHREIEAKSWLEEQLQRKNRELEDFTYMVSHELKNNLLSMQRVCELPMLQPELAKGSMVHYTELCSRLIIFIENLLILARAGRSLDQKKKVNLRRLIEEVSDRVIPRDGSVEMTIRQDLPSLTCAPLGMEQVFSNLIVNAMEHRLGDPLVIDISCQWEKGSVIIVLKDNGKGLDGEEQQAVFNLCYSKKPGTKFGFGLAIVKKIVEAHEGAVWAESEGKGKGTSFMVQLPFRGKRPRGR